MRKTEILELPLWDDTDRPEYSDFNVINEKVDAFVGGIKQETEDAASQTSKDAENTIANAKAAQDSANAAKLAETSAGESSAAAVEAQERVAESALAAQKSALAAAASAANSEASNKSAGTFAANAKVSESAAKASETAARNSEGAAKGSEDAALASKNAAGVSANLADLRAKAAQASETAAGIAEDNAELHKNAAAASAAQAQVSAESASERAAAAKASEDIATSKAQATAQDAANTQAYKNAAKISETNAAKSETNSKAHETAAGTSKNEAKKSELAAQGSATAAKKSEDNALVAAENAAVDAADGVSQKLSEFVADSTREANRAKTEADRAKDSADKAAEIVGGDFATRSEVAEAKSEAIVAAGTDSTAKANAAESRAKAASDPKGSAATAKTEAIQAASTDSTAKANAVDTKLTAHDGNTTKHITAAERTNWNAKETVAGAQAKADAAKNASDTKGSAAAVRTELLPMVNLKAPIASPSFTGAPTAPTAALGSTNTAQLATLGFVNNAVAAFVNGAPGALDTLNELAAALGDDPNFATTITNLIATKAARAVPATLGNLAKLDGNGNVVDSGKSAASFAPLVSPTFTGTPSAPTPAASANGTQLATTAFVKTAIGDFANGLFQLVITFAPDLSGKAFTVSGAGFATYNGIVPASLKTNVSVNQPSTVYTVTCYGNTRTVETAGWFGFYPVFIYNTPAVLADVTWSQIAKAAESGNVPSTWEIGSEKNITLTTGEVLTLQIYGNNHDDLASGGKAALTFGLKNLMATNQQMNSTNTNVGGFTGSALYTWLQGTLYNSLPADLKTVIKSVNKKTSAGNSSSTINTNAMKIFLFSEFECFGTAAFSADGEGAQYPIFTDNASRIKKQSNGAGSANSWWERSPSAGVAKYFGIFHSGGRANHTAASDTFGVCFGFCI